MLEDSGINLLRSCILRSLFRLYLILPHFVLSPLHGNKIFRMGLCLTAKTNDANNWKFHCKSGTMKIDSNKEGGNIHVDKSSD